MESKRRRTKLTPDEQDKLISDFLDELDDERFLGNGFVGEDDCVEEIVNGDDSEEDDGDNEEENNENDGEQDNGNNGLEGETDFTVEVVTNVPRKQKFVNLDAVCDEDNYDPLPTQKKKTYIYQNSKKTITMNYSTVKPDSTFQKRNNGNILHNEPGPRREAKRAKTVMDVFELFIDRSMLETVVEYTNKNIDSFIEKHQEIIRQSDKYNHYKRVDIIDIRAFFGILYLRAAFKLNLMNQNVIWNHETAQPIFSATICR